MARRQGGLGPTFHVLRFTFQVHVVGFRADIRTQTENGKRVSTFHVLRFTFQVHVVGFRADIQTPNGKRKLKN